MLTHERESAAVTIRVRLAQRNAHHATPDDVIKAADQALYRARNNGRNQCR